MLLNGEARMPSKGIEVICPECEYAMSGMGFEGDVWDAKYVLWVCRHCANIGDDELLYRVSIKTVVIRDEYSFE